MADAIDSDQAWREFWRRETREGYDAAMDWLTGPACTLAAREKPGLVLRIGRQNLEGIRVGQRTLTSNRRRPGSFE